MGNDFQKKQQRMDKYTQSKFGSKYQQKQQVSVAKPQVKTKEKCSTCKLTIRTTVEQHEKGAHHLGTVNKKH